MGIYAADIEYWKDVADYEDRYQVSTHGRVKSKSYLKSGANVNGPFSFMTKPSTMKQFVNPNGYLMIDWKKGGTRRTIAVHRIVAITFIGNPNKLPVVNHLDSDRKNNRVDNLEWTTQQGNIQHSYDSGSNSNLGELHPRHILTEDLVRCMRSMYQKGFTTRQVADYFGFRCDTTRAAITGRNWGHVA